MKFEKFKNIITDNTSNYYKINKEHYLSSGQYKIIDQGKDFIGGYTNDKNLVIETKYPVIIFGDHTRIFKYIDFPFAIGADGVKVLHVNQNNAYPKYIYYYLKSVRLPNAGYSRHFKFLKEFELPVPEKLEDQIKISTIISKAETLIKQRKESIDLLDVFLKSTFLKMFGDPIKNEKNWNFDLLGDSAIKITDGEHLSPKLTQEGFYIIMAKDVLDDKVDFTQNNFVSEPDFIKFTKKCNPENGDVLLVSRGATIGRCVVVHVDKPFCLMGSVILIKPNNNKLTGTFINYLFKNDSLYRKLIVTSGSSAQQAIYIAGLKKVKTIVPPIELQNQFSKIVKKAESLKQQLKNGLNELEQLYGSLSQRAFEGELDLSKVNIEKSEFNLVTQKEKYPEINNEILKVIEAANSITKQFEKVTEIEKVANRFNKYFEKWENLNKPFKSLPKIPPAIIEAQQRIEKIQSIFTENSKTKDKLSWDKVSSKQIARLIREKYWDEEKNCSFHINCEMLFRFLNEEHIIFPYYHSSEELKMNSKLNEADDFKSLIFYALKNENPYLRLNQFFYNGEEENFTLNITSEDYELIKNKTKEERSGIYFTIAK